MVDFQAVLESAQVWVQEIDGVQAVGECESEGKKCIYVYVTLPDAMSEIPSEYRGYNVIIEQGDPIHAQEGFDIGE